MRNSCQKIVVGHPHLNNIMEANKETIFTKNTLLVVSQPIINDELINTVIELVKKRKDLKVNYRLHPMEELSEKQSARLKIVGIEITYSNSDLYLEFLKNEFIFGCYSLSLVEACAFRKNIYILENEESKRYVPHEIGTWIKTGIDFAEKLSEKSKVTDFERYWASDFDKNFKKFIESLDIL